MRLGPYEIVAPLGAGGMGEVYRARDARLDRTVAIKVLPDTLAADPHFRERFDREARAVAALNHPHICTLYDIGVQDGASFLVMEYVEGETLAARLERGAMPVDQALKAGIEVASALARAHRAGITHRDLKPANVMLTRSGAKLLDFGLAKAGASVLAGAPAAAGSALLTEDRALTAQGTILGTFQYMAPEQLEGQDAGARTDIFAFGALLYEMLTGTRAFAGTTKTSLIAAIVSAVPPPISSVQPLTPPALDHVVQKCLAKDPDDRWQSMHDVAEELRWIGAAGSQAGVAAPLTMRRKTRERLAWMTAAAALLGLAVAGALALRGRVPPAVYSFTIPRADAGYVSSDLAVVSPDGQWFCFSARPAEGKPPKLFVRSASSFDVRALDGTENEGDFQWGLDGRSIVFVADGKIRVVEVTGGSPRTVAESSDAGGLAMNREGVVLAGSGTAGIWRFAARGGAGERITTPDKGRHEIWHGYPVFLPDGKRFLYISFVRDPSKREQPHYLHAGSLDSRETKFIGEIGSRVAYAPPGYLLSIKDGTLMSVRFDADRLEIHGEPEPLADAVYYFKPTGHADFSASANGTVTYRAPFGGESLVWVDRTGHRTGALPVTGDFSSVRLSGDGASVVAGLVDPRIGTTDLWLYGARRETATRLTFSAGYEDGPTLTPDGARVFYSSDALGIPDIFVKQMGSAEDDRPFLVAPGAQVPLDVSPDGKWLVYMTADYGGTREDLYVTPLEGDPRPIPFVRTPASETSARFSPDGTAVAYTSNESGDFQVYVKAFPGPGQAHQVSTKGGRDPVWSHDGRQLYFLHSNGVYEADVRAPDAEPHLLFETHQPLQALEASPDGTRFLVIMVDDLAMQTPTRVIVNWPALLKNGK